MLRFGVAGYPLAYKASEHGRSRFAIMPWLADLGLDALELQMTYGPRTTVENCRNLRCAASDHGITLSVHASYFIVLTSSDNAKIRRSIDTLKRTCDLAGELGATVAVLHPGSTYQGADAALARFIDNATQFEAEYGRSTVGVFVESAGKLGQLGSVPEILSIAGALSGFHPCIDFGHVHARTLGGLATADAVGSLFRTLEGFMFANPGKRWHFHFTPIHYGAKGEIQHRAIHDRYPVLEPAQAGAVGASSADGYYHPRPGNVARWFKGITRDTTVISETHNSQEQGATALRDYLVPVP